MYTPSYFDESRLPVLHKLMRQHPLATVIATIRTGLEANHVPLLLDAQRGPFGTLRGHIARANPLWREAPAGTPVLALFHGPDHYVSPAWYASKAEHGKVVPTWNYVVVHGRGRIQWFEDPEWLLALLQATTDQHERTRPAPWQVGDAPPDYIRQNLAAIVGFEIPIEDLRGKCKLSQNRSDADRAGVVAGLLGLGGSRAQEMARAMQGQGEDGCT